MTTADKIAELAKKWQDAAIVVAPLGQASGEGRWTAAECLREAAALRLAEQPLGDVAGLVERADKALAFHPVTASDYEWSELLACAMDMRAALTTLSRRNAELEAENALFLDALKFVGPGLLVLRNMCGTANLPIGEQRAKDMIEAVRQALGEKYDA